MTRLFISFPMFRGVFLGVLLSLLCILKKECFVRIQLIRKILLAALAYLAIPSLLFCFSLPLPLPHRSALCLLVMYCFFSSVRKIKNHRTFPPCDYEYKIRLDFFLMGILLLALNQGAIFFDLSVVGDWHKHRSVLMSLYENPWDPLLCTGFDCSAQVAPGMHLVYYYAMYLPGVYVCKLLGGMVSSLAGPSLWSILSVSFLIWNLLGMMIVFLLLPVVCQVLFKTKDRVSWGIFYPVLIFFAGMDYWFIWIHKKTWLIGHAEWGATAYNAQMSSFISMWSWVPHQLVVGFLGISLLILFSRNFSLFPFCLWTVFLLSGASLAWIGSIPILVYFLVVRFLDIRQELSWGCLRNIFAANLINILAGLFITMTIFLFYSTKVEAEGFDILLKRTTVGDFLLFHFIEFYPTFMLVVAYRLLRRTVPPILGFLFGWIVFIAMFHGGNWNDLVMRGSLPALSVIMIFCAYAVQAVIQKKRTASLILVLLVLLLTFPLFLNEYFVALEGMHPQLEEGYAVYMQYAGDGRVRGVWKLFNL